MTAQKEEKNSLKEKFGEVAINVNGLCLKISADSQNLEVISDNPMKIDHHTTTNAKTNITIVAAQETNDNAKYIYAGTSIKVNSLSLEVSADGRKLGVISPNPVEISLSTTDALKTETAIAAAQTALKIGDIAKDGWIYAGISDDPKSPGYKKPLWVAAEDDGVMTHYDAKRTAFELSKGNNKVRLPTLIELSQIFNSLAKKGKGGFSQDKYWAEEYKRFSFITKYQKIPKQEDIASVRLVR